jgi:hypothetical protein
MANRGEISDIRAQQRRRAVAAQAPARAPLSEPERRRQRLERIYAEAAQRASEARRELDAAFTRDARVAARAATADTHAHKHDVTESEEAGDGDFVCGICLRFKNDNMAIDPCGHCNYCRPCLRQWFNDNNSCPMCRTPSHKYLRIYPGRVHKETVVEVD